MRGVVLITAATVPVELEDKYIVTSCPLTQSSEAINVLALFNITSHYGMMRGVVLPTAAIVPVGVEDKYLVTCCPFTHSSNQHYVPLWDGEGIKGNQEIGILV